MATVPKISFVLPAYNEAEILERTVRDVTEIGNRLEEDFEIVIVENGSRDDTKEIALRLAKGCSFIQYATIPVGDYGEAMRTGLVEANGDIAVVFDCDLYDYQFAADAVQILDGESIAVVVASKRHEESSDQRSLFRRAGTATFSLLIRKLCGMKASDSHGMKVVDLRVAKNLVLDCQLRGHVFDTELVIRSERAGLTVAELPCNVEEKRPARSSYLSRVIPALRQAIALRKAVRN